MTTTTRAITDHQMSNRTNYESYHYKDSNTDGIVTKKNRVGSYNVIEKDYGDHKRIYHVPIEYGDNFDLTQLDEPKIMDETQPVNSPRLIRRRIYHEYDDYNQDYSPAEDYFEKAPAVSARRVYVSPRRNTRETELVQRVYETAPLQPVKKVEYIYEDDNANLYEYRSETPEEIEYIRTEKPKTLYVEEIIPPPRVVYVDEPLVSQRSPRNVPSPTRPIPPVRHSPPMVRHVSPISAAPAPAPYLNTRFNSMSPPPSHRNPQINRIVPPEPPKLAEPAPLRLMDIVAQNRARRGNRLPRPRREVDEAKIYDPPTYNRNIIKNGFIVHK